MTQHQNAYEIDQLKTEILLWTLKYYAEFLSQFFRNGT